MPKNVLPLAPILPTQNGNVDAISKIVQILNQDNIGVQVDFTGSLSGSIQVQVSLNHVEDFLGNVTVDGTWAPLLLKQADGSFATSVPITSGSPSPLVLDLNQLSAPYLRVTWSHSGGSGNITMVASSKAV